MKKVIILNGMALSGKDTFAKLLSDYIPTIKYSSIDLFKEMAYPYGLKKDVKTEKERKLLSNLKQIWGEYNDLSFTDLRSIVSNFKNNLIQGELLIIDIREPVDIKRAKKEFDAITVYVKRNNVKWITSNPSDANVEKYNYDYTVKNNGSMENLKNEVDKFYSWLMKNYCNKNECDKECLNCKLYIDDDGALYCKGKDDMK